jgi:P-type Cu+ transporter
MEARLSQVKEKTTCFHCGDECRNAPVVTDEHNFCCDGCRLVYELLKENNLCTYYDITRNPGHAAVAEKAGIYASLDDPSIRQKLVRFENNGISRVTFHVPSMHCSSCIWLLGHLRRLKEKASFLRR